MTHDHHIPALSPGEWKGHLIVIGLGNEYLSDDGVGIYAVRRVRERLGDCEGVAFEELAVGGLSLLDYIIGYDRCIIIDALSTGRPVGTVDRYSQSTSQTIPRFTTSHQIDLSHVLGLAKLFHANIPHTIAIYGIEASDVTTFGTRCTDAVEHAIPDLVEMVANDIMHTLPGRAAGACSGMTGNSNTAEFAFTEQL